MTTFVNFELDKNIPKDLRAVLCLFYRANFSSKAWAGVDCKYWIFFWYSEFLYKFDSPEFLICRSLHPKQSLFLKWCNSSSNILVQNLDPCACDCEDCGLFFRNVMTYVVGSITIFAGLVVVCHFFVLRSNKRSSYEIIERDEDEDPLSWK